MCILGIQLSELLLYSNIIQNKGTKENISHPQLHQKFVPKPKQILQISFILSDDTSTHCLSGLHQAITLLFDSLLNYWYFT